MSSSLKRNLISGILWSFGGRAAYLLLALIGNIILARLLSPQEFGQVGIIMFFITIANVLTESGLSGALIRKNDATPKDFSTVFIFNFSISLLLFIVFVSSAGYVADFYNDPALKNILIVTSAILIINAFQFTHNAKLVRDLKFKKIAVYAFISTLLGTFIGIILAIKGAGVWAIISVSIFSSLIQTLLLWIFEGPVEKLIFSKQSFQVLYKFGLNTTLASIINTAFENVYQLLLGKYFSINQTGLFYQAKKLQEVPIGIIKSTTLGVVFSALSKLQSDKNIFEQYYRRILNVFTVFLGLIICLIFLYAENIILLLYGEKWIGAVFYMQLLSLASFFYMQEMLNRIIFKVFNQTSKILFLEIIKNSIQMITLVLGVLLLDLDVLMYGLLLTSMVSYFINFYYSRKVLGSFSWQEIILIFKVVFASIVSVGGVILLVELFGFDNYYSFLCLPIMISGYFLLLNAFGVTNIISEVKNVLTLIKNKNA